MTMNYFVVKYRYMYQHISYYVRFSYKNHLIY